MWDNDIQQSFINPNLYNSYDDSRDFIPPLDSVGFGEGYQLPAEDTLNVPGLLDSPANVVANIPATFLPQNPDMESFYQMNDSIQGIQQGGSRTSLHEVQVFGSNEASRTTSPRHGSLPRRKSWYSRSSGKKKTPPRYIPFSSASPSQTPPNSTDPLQRWRDSPPEDEPASFLAIHNALQDVPSRPGSAEGNSKLETYHRGASITSVDSIGSNSSTSASSMISTVSSQGGRASSSRPGGRVSKHRKPPKLEKDARPFCCTFCCDRFKTKYDWARHEKSLHLSLETWTCAPNGGTYTSAVTNMDHCVYCDFPNPNPDHLEAHNHDLCQRNDPESRMFRRKDNLIQHLRHVHLLDSPPQVEQWKASVQYVLSRCGICDLKMTSWKERQDHLATHFRYGQTMKDWKGDHGFEPSVASLVTNNLPPYLIGAESSSLIPFSATSKGTKDHFHQIQHFADSHSKQKEPVQQPKAPSPGPILPDFPQQLSTHTYAQVLTLHLGRYAQRQMRLGIIPTDEMFQEESRRICYNSEDPWNQTIADNDEWLNTFKSNHCGTNETSPQDPKGA